MITVETKRNSAVTEGEKVHFNCICKLSFNNITKVLFNTQKKRTFEIAKEIVEMKEIWKYTNDKDPHEDIAAGEMSLFLITFTIRSTCSLFFQ